MAVFGLVTLLYGASGTNWRGTPNVVVSWIIVACGAALVVGSRTLKQK